MNTLLIALLLLVHPPQDPCQAVRVSAGAERVSPGNGIGVFTLVTNCTEKKVSYAVDVVVVSACGESAVIKQTDPADTHLDPGEAEMVPASYQVPPGACEGGYTAISSIRKGRKSAGAGSVVFMVER